ncbi:hypothetical protein [Streptomyces sp. NPDC057545]|uniref:hypothetical protein n=1 Tax=Streptomyces sp. NPDC057545 TaxID=3346164 RepID=UPI00368D5578
MALFVLFAVSVASCSGNDGAAPSGPSQWATDDQGGQSPDEPASAGNGVPGNDDLERMLPAVTELPAGWKPSGSDSVGWRDVGDGQIEAHALECGALPQEAAERHSFGNMQQLVAGNESQGEGVSLTAYVPTGPDENSVASSSDEAVDMIEANLTLSREKLYKCFAPKEAGVGDTSIVFKTEQFMHILMRVGPVQVVVDAPADGRPTAEEWARVMEQRVRAVLDGQAPTSRVALP